jgi:hypothetical protein
MRSFCLSKPRMWRRPALAAALAFLMESALAAVGVNTLVATDTDGPVTMYYPTNASVSTVKRGPFKLELAENGEPIRGNGHLVFIVAFPQHHTDNSKDSSNSGPNSWAIRPQEVSRAIDAVGRDPRFSPLLALEHVGVYGMSAGGHTALSMAGGRWSAAGFKNHCEANLVEDFQTCVGLITRLTGGILDGIKKWVALAAIGRRFDDTTMLSHEDLRVAAVVAGVPVAADFEMASLAKPRVPVGLVTARQDRWLTPRFHSGRLLQVCTTCEHIADIAHGGHGALLSPPPLGLTGVVGDILNDPPDFDRSQMREVDQKIAAFFVKHVVSDPSRSSRRPVHP